MESTPHDAHHPGLKIPAHQSDTHLSACMLCGPSPTAQPLGRSHRHTHGAAGSTPARGTRSCPHHTPPEAHRQCTRQRSSSSSSRTADRAISRKHLFECWQPAYAYLSCETVPYVSCPPPSCLLRVVHSTQFYPPPFVRALFPSAAGLQAPLQMVQKSHTKIETLQQKKELVALPCTP
jgi:hypothetical protein